MMTRKEAEKMRRLYTEMKPFVAPSDALSKAVRNVFDLPDTEPLDLWISRAACMADGFLQACKAFDPVVEALEKIRENQWTPVTDGSGPEDCTPNEKGLLAYVGQTSITAKEALSKAKEAGAIK